MSRLLYGLLLQLCVLFVVAQAAATDIPWAHIQAVLDSPEGGSDRQIRVLDIGADLWGQLGGWELGRLLLMMGALLAVMLTLTRTIARTLGFAREDEIAIVFCGTKKSLASGMPMASVLFADAAGLGALVLPLMIFHQLQLMACGVIATRYAKAAPRLEAIAQDAAPP